MAYSGRCLLSGYFNRRDSNQGTCTNACRWNYTPSAGTDQTNSGEVLGRKLEGGFAFSAEQHDASQSFSACGSSARHPLANQVFCLRKSSAPANSCPSWKTSTAPTS